MIRSGHGACKINAGHKWEGADDGGFARYRQTILVIDRGVRNSNRHITRHQIGICPIGKADGLAGIGFFNEQGAERVGHY